MNSSAPAMMTAIRPTGKTAPKTNLARPGLAAASSGLPLPTMMASSPPKAMNAPARKPSTSCFEVDRPALAQAAVQAASAICFGVL